MSLITDLTWFYGASWEEQMQMPVPVWVGYVRDLPGLVEREVARWAVVAEPIVYAALIAPVEQKAKARGVKAIRKMLDGLRGGVDKRGKSRGHKYGGKLSEKASKRLDAQVRSLMMDPSLKDKIVVRATGKVEES